MFCRHSAMMHRSTSLGTRLFAHGGIVWSAVREESGTETIDLPSLDPGGSSCNVAGIQTIYTYRLR